MGHIEIQVYPGISYAWRSLYQGFRVLKLVLQCKISDRLSIYAWHDPWILKPYLFKTLPYKRYLAKNLRVTNLISPKPRCWNIQVLQYFFRPHEVEYIQEIPLKQCPGLDI